MSSYCTKPYCHHPLEKFVTAKTDLSIGGSFSVDYDNGEIAGFGSAALDIDTIWNEHKDGSKPKIIAGLRLTGELGSNSRFLALAPKIGIHQFQPVNGYAGLYGAGLESGFVFELTEDNSVGCFFSLVFTYGYNTHVLLLDVADLRLKFALTATVMSEEILIGATVGGQVIF